MLPAVLSSRHNSGYPSRRGSMGRCRVGPHAIEEYLRRMRDRYETVPRAAKGRLLDEVCEVTRYHRKAEIPRLRRPPRARRRRRGGPPVQYGPDVVAVLRAIWTAAGYPWSVRLKALLPLWLAWARGEVRLAVVLDGPGRPAVGAAARAPDRRARGQGPPDQSASDRSVPAGGQTHAAPPAIRPHQTGDVAETPDSAADRPLGRARAGLHGDRPGGAFGRSRRRRVSPLVERDRHSHDVGGDARGAGQGPAPRAGGP